LKETPVTTSLFVEPETKNAIFSWRRAGDEKSKFEFGSIPTKFEKTG
jgi:hypothetical protein